ncbi:MAG TPA: FAD-binding oxidoreductase [Kofleriaceae bacterium]|nr:FAD-binding oxidoreductase [Kofleriaceae bacterium]
MEPASVPPETEARHARKVARIVDQLRRHTGDRPLSMKKRGVSHQVPKAKDLRRDDEKIDLTDLTEILAIDPARRLCVAEAGVTFVDLVTATMKHHLVPIVVPELKTITIGGAVAGCSIESMSFHEGGFHDSCVEYEVVTATAEVLTCTADNEHAQVFEMVHGTFGTVGILTRLTFRLVPAKEFVHLVHEKHATLEAYLAAIERHATSGKVDFIDGIIHSPTLWVLCLGYFVDRAPYTNRYDWVKVFYKSTATRDDDYLRTPDYFFRYDRGVTNVRPKSLVGRLLLGKVLSSTQWLWLGDKLHWLLARERPTITVDLFVPVRRAVEFMAWYRRELDYFPLWCVPYRLVKNYAWLDESLHPPPGDNLFLDLAIYGMRQRGRDGRNYHRLIEEKLREVGGIKTLISHNYYPEAEFWQLWNKRNYDAVKARTDPKNLLRDLYAKTCKAAMGRT